MTTAPIIVVAEVQQDREDYKLGSKAVSIPGVEVRVEFRLGDDVAALKALARAVEDVVDQIGQATFQD